MSKFFLFLLLVWLFRNPFLALVVIIIIIYVVDRRFVGLLPSFTRTFQTKKKMKMLRNELKQNPHHTSNRLELARLLADKKSYTEANELLEKVLPVMEDSAEVRCDLGMVRLKLGQLEEGEKLILEGVALNPRVKFGLPFLKLGEAYCSQNRDKALHYMEQFRSVQSSSCEVYYHLGVLYLQMQKPVEAQAAFSEGIDVYRSLPKYKKRFERKWVLKCWFKKGFNKKG